MSRWWAALVGLTVGCVLAGLLVLLPAALSGGFYEIEDALIVMGVPLVAVGAAVGFLLGQRRRRTAGPAPSPSTAAGPGLVVALAVCVLALWLFLWGVGAVPVAPLGLG